MHNQDKRFNLSHERSQTHLQGNDQGARAGSLEACNVTAVGWQECGTAMNCREHYFKEPVALAQVNGLSWRDATAGARRPEYRPAVQLYGADHHLVDASHACAPVSGRRMGGLGVVLGILGVAPLSSWLTTRALSLLSLYAACPPVVVVVVSRPGATSLTALFGPKSALVLSGLSTALAAPSPSTVVV